MAAWRQVLQMLRKSPQAGAVREGILDAVRAEPPLGGYIVKEAGIAQRAGHYCCCCRQGRPSGDAS